MYLKITISVMLLLTLAFVVVLSACTLISYNYRWQTACVRAHGTKMRSAYNTPLCVRGQSGGAIEIVQLAVNPLAWQ